MVPSALPAKVEAFGIVLPITIPYPPSQEEAHGLNKVCKNQEFFRINLTQKVLNQHVLNECQATE